MLFFQFLLNPNCVISKTKKTYFTGLLLDFVLLLLLNLIIGVTSSFFALRLGFDFGFKRSIQYTSEHAILIIFLGPIIEEFTFRAPLKISYLSLLLFSIGVYKIMENSTPKYYSLSMVIIVVAVIWCKYRSLRIIVTKNINLLVYISSIIFGLLHLSNLSFEKLTFPVFLLYSFPIIFAGLTYAYIRMKYNLFLAILLHSLYNSLPFLFVFLGVIDRP